MSKRKIDLLIVDDDDELRRGLVQYFRQLGCVVADASEGDQALEKLSGRAYQVAVLDMVMPGMSGIDLLRKVRGESMETEVILLTAHGDVESAVEAMKLGAFDFLAKPVRMKQLEAVVCKAAESGRLRNENRRLRVLLERSKQQQQMIGQSPAIREVHRLIERAGPSGKPILVQGESGTGKELVARALHEASSRAGQPLVVVNCAALPDQLLESELFGHEKGAFTGAVAAKPGLFEAADGGTLLIDEVGELSPALQPKLLRILEDGSLRRVGSLQERRVDVRVIAATNRDLLAETRAKRFREDLYYRLNVMTIDLPPLRERAGDVALLAEHFAGHDWEFEPECIAAITQHDWPGNVRQLINAIERTKILADDSVLCRKNLPPEVLHGASTAAPRLNPEAKLADLTRARVVHALQQENGNKLRAAKKLGVSRRSLYRLIEKYDVGADEAAS